MRSLIDQSQILFKALFRAHSKVIHQAIPLSGLTTTLFGKPLSEFAGRRFQRTFILLVFSMLALYSSHSLAETRIGFVDIPYLIEKAPQALDAEQRLEDEFGPRQLELKLQRDELNDIKEKLEAEGLEMSESERGQVDREARGLERRLKRDEQDFREELNIQKNNEFKKVRILVLEAIARFGKSNDYDLIVSDGVLYANKSIDVTEKILADLVKTGQSMSSTN